jgi:hypothetical protein
MSQPRDFEPYPQYKQIDKKFSRYSGDESIDFWDVVNGLKSESNHKELYSLGVALQNFEHYVLQKLANALIDEEEEE